MVQSSNQTEILKKIWSKTNRSSGTQLEAPKLESGANWRHGLREGLHQSSQPIHEEMCVGKMPSGGGNTKWRITYECVYKCANGSSIFVVHAFDTINKAELQPHGTIENDVRPFAKSVNGMETWLRGGNMVCVEGFRPAWRQARLCIWTSSTPDKQKVFQTKHRGRARSLTLIMKMWKHLCPNKLRRWCDMLAPQWFLSLPFAMMWFPNEHNHLVMHDVPYTAGRSKTETSEHKKMHAANGQK